jgi:hypothetical protein
MCGVCISDISYSHQARRIDDYNYETTGDLVHCGWRISGQTVVTEHLPHYGWRISGQTVVTEHLPHYGWRISGQTVVTEHLPQVRMAIRYRLDPPIPGIENR